MKAEKAFSISKSLLRNQKAMVRRKEKRPNALPLKSFVKTETFRNDMGWLLTTYDSCLWIQVLCTFFRSFQLSQVAERWAAAAGKISPRVISDLQTTGCQAARWKTHLVLVLQPFWSDRNQSEWGGTCDSNLGLSLPWDSKRQRKSSSYTSPQKRKEHTEHRSKVLTLPQLFSTCVQSSEHLTRRKTHSGKTTRDFWEERKTMAKHH